MCGDHPANGLVLIDPTGSSPHVRGPRLFGKLPLSHAGIIPACAGTTSRTTSGTATRRDHPRMCGDHVQCQWMSIAWGGSSPHVRGPLFAQRESAGAVGIIPACAGTTPKRERSKLYRWDHPRMCGDHLGRFSGEDEFSGSSPHVRGPRAARLGERPVGRIIPACAGTTAISVTSLLTLWDHPRMCGDHSSTVEYCPLRKGSSPHVRGPRR